MNTDPKIVRRVARWLHGEYGSTRHTWNELSDRARKQWSNDAQIVISLAPNQTDAPEGGTPDA